MLNAKIDWKATHRRVVDILAMERLPWHYRQLYHKAVVFGSGQYSDKTDPVEKFRQYYAEHKRAGIGFMPGAYLVLKKWFPDKQQLGLFPNKPMILHGNCIISYEAGFEQANRQRFMKDHFNDTDTVHRHERRRRAALVESHIKHYFSVNYGEFYAPPTNHADYEAYSNEDFFLCLPQLRIAVDVKSWSYKHNGQDIGVARKIISDNVYLWGDWADDETVLMHGVCGGEWLKIIGENKGELTHIPNNLTWPIDCLLVLLNMTRSGMSYWKFKRELR